MWHTVTTSTGITESNERERGRHVGTATLLLQQEGRTLADYARTRLDPFDMKTFKALLDLKAVTVRVQAMRTDRAVFRSEGASTTPNS